MEMIKGKRGK